MEKNIAAELFKALSDENRLTVLSTLKNGEMCAGDILELLNITQPTLSHHMKTLCDAGIVTARKDGKRTYYSIAEQTVIDLLNFANEIFGLEKENLRTVAYEKIVEAPKKDIPSYLL